MSLRRGKTIQFSGGYLSVRALTAQEFSDLFDAKAAELGRLFDHSIGENPHSLLENEAMIRGIISVLLRDVGTLISRAIAIAADVPGRHAEAASLPLDVQLAALESIVGQTFGKPKNARIIARRLGIEIGNLSSRSSRFISGLRH